MRSKRLYEISKSFTEGESKAFVSWVKSENSRRSSPKFLQLHDRLRSLKKFSEQALKNGLFKSSSHFSQVKRELLEKWITFFSKESGQGVNYPKLSKAIDFGALEYAKTLLQTECELHMDRGEWDYCFFLIEFGRKLEEDHKFPIFETFKFDVDKFIVDFKYLILLRENFRNGKQFFSKTIFEKSRQAQALFSIISFQSEAPVIKYMEQKVSILANTLGEKFEKAFEEQETLAGWLAEAHFPFVSNLKLMNELSQAITAALHLDDFDSVRRFTYHLSKINTTTDFERSEKEKFLVLRSIETGYATYDLDLLLKSRNLLFETQDSPFSRAFGTHLYILALSFVYFEKYSLAKQLLREIKKGPTNLTWQPTLLEIIISYKEGAIFDDWIKLSRAIKNKMNSIQVEYPWFVLQVLKQIIDHPELDRDPILQTALAEIRNLKKVPSERRAMLYFDFEFFARSILENVPMITIQQSNPERMFKMVN